jgi:hypothetical protein
MAIPKIIILEDDFDGSKAEETVAFALDRSSYEIDLNHAYAQELRDVLRPYAETARRIPSSTARGVRCRHIGRDGASTAEVGAWAREQGLDISVRGRISAGILEKYAAAH